MGLNSVTVVHVVCMYCAWPQRVARCSFLNAVSCVHFAMHEIRVTYIQTLVYEVTAQ